MLTFHFVLIQSTFSSELPHCFAFESLLAQHPRTNKWAYLLEEQRLQLYGFYHIFYKHKGQLLGRISEEEGFHFPLKNGVGSSSDLVYLWNSKHFPSRGCLQWLTVCSVVIIRHLSLQPGVQITRKNSYWQSVRFSVNPPSSFKTWISALFILRGTKTQSFNYYKGVSSTKTSITSMGAKFCADGTVQTQTSIIGQARNH